MSETTLAASNAANNYTLKNNEDGSFAIKKATTDVLTISSAGIITGSASSTLVGNGPAFRVGLSASQSITSATQTLVNLDTVVFDTASAFNVSTHRFSPAVAGYYQINATVAAGAASAMSRVGVIIYGVSNGVAATQLQWGTDCYPGQTTAGQASASTLVYLNGAGDYVELRGVVTATTPVFSGGNANLCSLSGSLVRAA